MRPPSTIAPHTHGRPVTEVTTRETVYRLTSLYPEEAGPAEWWALARHPWSIEAMHHLEDGSDNADGSTMRTGHGPATITTWTRRAIAIPAPRLRAGAGWPTLREHASAGVAGAGRVAAPPIALLVRSGAPGPPPRARHTPLASPESPAGLFPAAAVLSDLAPGHEPPTVT